LPRKFKTYKNSDDYEKDRRKRNRRIEKRITKLERMAKVENVIRRLTAKTTSFAKEEMKYLFDTALITEYTYRSFSNNNDIQRIDYFIDLFINYSSADLSEFTHFLLMFRTSSENTLSQAETDIIQNFFIKYLPQTANVRFGYGIDENLGTEVSMLLLGCR